MMTYCSTDHLTVYIKYALVGLYRQKQNCIGVRIVLRAAPQQDVPG